MKAGRFDRDVTLAELLRAVPRPRLDAALDRTVGSVWCMVDTAGTLLWASKESAGSEMTAFPLRVEIETVGHLQVPPQCSTQAEIAVRWLDMVLASAYRYQMAADLHFETVTADYEALQRQHAVLQESEMRYRELACELEQRVKAQVEVIEHTQRQLYQTEKLASIGSLAAGMAHEINNPIGFIRSNLATATGYVEKMGEMCHALRQGDSVAAQALWVRLDMDFVLEDFSGLLQESLSGADRVARIVANLKAYSKIDCTDAAAADLNDAVRAAAGVVSDQLPDGVAIEMDLQPLPSVVCDLSRMNQVLFALLQNAQQAMIPGGGVVRIASRVSHDEIRIAVSDQGRGIREEIRSRIFDPFFTTQEVGKGMGLGLTVSRDIVNAHGGRIEVETASGSGSTFTICLPTDFVAATASHSERPT